MSPADASANSNTTRDGTTAGEDKVSRLWSVLSPYGEPTSLRAKSEPTKLCIWNLREEPQVAVLQSLGEELGDGADRVFSSDGKWLVTLSNPAELVHLWNLTTSPPTEFVLRHSGLASPAFSGDGHWLATGGWDDPTVALWDLTTKDPSSDPTILRGHTGGIRSLAFSNDGQRLVSGANDRLAIVWDLTVPNQPKRSITLPGGGGKSIVRRVSSPNGR